MENSEEILAVLKALDDRLSSPMRIRIFDLCFTNKRLVIIMPKLVKRTITWNWLSYRTLKGRNILKEKQRRKQDPLMGLTIDELLEKDKSSYAINYDDLKWICVNTSFSRSNLQFRTGKIWKLIEISKKQFKQLSQILPRIVALKGKLEINQ
jgi:hypothetical protein